MPEPPQTSTDAITVELFGMPRVLAGTGSVVVAGASLRDVLQGMVTACPDLGNHVLRADGDWLNAGYTFVVDGTFIGDPDLPVGPGTEILLVSRASGG